MPQPSARAFASAVADACATLLALELPDAEPLHPGVAITDSWVSAMALAMAVAAESAADEASFKQGQALHSANAPDTASATAFCAMELADDNAELEHCDKTLPLLLTVEKIRPRAKQIVLIIESKWDLTDVFICPLIYFLIQM